MLCFRCENCGQKINKFTFSYLIFGPEKRCCKKCRSEFEVVNLFKIANEIYASASFIAMIALFSAVHSIFFNNKKEYFLAAFIIFVVLYFAIKVVTKFQNFGTFLIKNYSFAKVVIANLR